MMRIEYDPTKRETTLRDRGLDMADAGTIFDGPTITIEDDRREYGETRYISVGFPVGRMVFVAWTLRGDARRIISLRKANTREQETYSSRFR